MLGQHQFSCEVVCRCGRKAKMYVIAHIHPIFHVCTYLNKVKFVWSLLGNEPMIHRLGLIIRTYMSVLVEVSTKLGRGF